MDLMELQVLELLLQLLLLIPLELHRPIQLEQLMLTEQELHQQLLDQLLHCPHSFHRSSHHSSHFSHHSSHHSSQAFPPATTSAVMAIATHFASTCNAKSMIQLLKGMIQLLKGDKNESKICFYFRQ
jgi:hypothetical protein